MDPLTLLALALTAAGTGAQYVGAQKAQNAQAQVVGAERKRNEERDRQAYGINEKSRRRFAGENEDQAQKTAELANLYEHASDGAPTFGPAPTDSNVTVQHEASEKAKAKGYTDQQAGARANLLSFGDVFGDLSRNRAEDATKLAAIDSERRGSQGVLPLELDAAGQEGSGWRLGGDILQGAGSLATMGALSGASLPGLGATAGSTPSLIGGPMHRPIPGRPGGLLSLFSR